MRSAHHHSGLNLPRATPTSRHPPNCRLLQAACSRFAAAWPSSKHTQTSYFAHPAAHPTAQCDRPPVSSTSRHQTLHTQPLTRLRNVVGHLQPLLRGVQPRNLHRRLNHRLQPELGAGQDLQG